MKKCPYCNIDKAITDYYSNPSHPDGLQSQCKPCSNVRRNNAPSSPVNMRLSALKILGEECISCGYSDVRALQIDHVNGGGSQERKITPGGSKGIYRKIVNGQTEGYQVLCANCNCIKRVENKEIGFYCLQNKEL